MNKTTPQGYLLNSKVLREQVELIMRSNKEELDAITKQFRQFEHDLRQIRKQP